jgi:hypothetical protein
LDHPTTGHATVASLRDAGGFLPLKVPHVAYADPKQFAAYVSVLTISVRHWNEAYHQFVFLVGAVSRPPHAGNALGENAAAQKLLGCGFDISFQGNCVCAVEGDGEPR